MVFAALDCATDWLAEAPAAYESMLREQEAMLASLGVVPDLSSSIAYSNAWWINGRNQSISVRLIARSPESSRAAPLKVSPEILELLNGFVKVDAKRFTLSVLPTADDDEDADSELAGPDVSAAAPRAQSPETADRARALRSAAVDHMRAICSAGRLPHRLEAPTATELAGRETGIPKKQIISKALRPLGYEHLGKFGAQGVMCFGKITPSNTKLLVNFDFGTWSPRIEAILTASGARWTASVPILFREPSDSPRYHYTPPTREAFSRAVDNIAFVLRELETIFVAPLESELGPSPDWTASL